MRGVTKAPKHFEVTGEIRNVASDSFTFNTYVDASL